MPQTCIQNDSLRFPVSDYEARNGKFRASTISRQNRGTPEARQILKTFKIFYDLNTAHHRTPQLETIDGKIYPAKWAPLHHKTDQYPRPLRAWQIDQILDRETIYGLKARSDTRYQTVRIDIDAHNLPEPQQIPEARQALNLIAPFLTAYYSEISAGRRGLAVHLVIDKGLEGLDITHQLSRLTKSLNDLVGSTQCTVEIQSHTKVISLHNPRKLAAFLNTGEAMTVSEIEAIALASPGITEPRGTTERPQSLPAGPSVSRAQRKAKDTTRKTSTDSPDKLNRSIAVLFEYQNKTNGGNLAGFIDYYSEHYGDGPNDGRRSRRLQWVWNKYSHLHDPTQSRYSWEKSGEYIRSRIPGWKVEKYKTTYDALAALEYLVVVNSQSGVRGFMGSLTCTTSQKAFIALGMKLHEDEAIKAPWNEKHYTNAYRCLIATGLITEVAGSNNRIHKARTLIPARRAERIVALKALSSTIYADKAQRYLALMEGKKTESTVVIPEDDGPKSLRLEETEVEPCGRSSHLVIAFGGVPAPSDGVDVVERV